MLFLGMLFAGASFATVGFQQVTVPDRQAKSMQAGIWYPSNTQTSVHPLGLMSQDVALDWVLSSWPGRVNLNSRRIGMFGFSLGGFTTLVLIGGTPELPRMAQLCDSKPSAPECTFIKSANGDQLTPSKEIPLWVHDARVKAAVVAAEHFVFLAPCSEALGAAAPQICQDPPGFDRAAFHRSFNQSVVDFFITNLRER
jgi:predicted dienelactone hydrolase